MKIRSSFAVLLLLLATLACNILQPEPAAVATSQPSYAATITRELDTIRKGSDADKMSELAGTVPLNDGDLVQITKGGEAVLDFGGLLQMRMFNDSKLNAVKATSAIGVPLDVQMTLEAGGFTGILTPSGSQAEYETPGGTRIVVLGTKFFVIYDPTSGDTTVGNFQGIVGIEAGGVGSVIHNGSFVVVARGGPPGPEMPIQFTIQDFNARARALHSPIDALGDLIKEPTPTSSKTPSPSPTASLTPTLTPTFTTTPRPTNTYTPKPTNTYIPRPTTTYTPRPTNTYTPGPTTTYSPGPTNTYSPGPTNTYSPGLTNTFTPTPLPIATSTLTPTP